MNAKFRHYDLILVEPDFGSSVTDLIIELDYLRKIQLTGTTHPVIFFQVKQLFHMMESIGSARIEGNNTTIAEFIETKIDMHGHEDQSILEIQNLEDVMNFVDETMPANPISRSFISELHKLTLKDLLPPPEGEGDKTPGIYRKSNVAIHRSSHKPPDFTQIENYMDELIDFINRKDEPKYDLLKVAMAHHRFVWIHPFANGNGRTARLLTYAMLIRHGFNVRVGRIINPTAIFCHDRELYIDKLAAADDGQRSGMLDWCEYVLKGLKLEIEKIDRLLDYEYLSKTILIPAIRHSLARRLITELESKILIKAAEKQVIQASDLKEFVKKNHSSEITRVINKLREKNMLVPEKENGRKYVLRFDNNYLLRGVVKTLDENGFLPIKD